eukprot:CAMPEP_0118969288 /NCGR_PEP_ID=MMETSP1173-20130426/6397_1 /TAXON_ID=1034831 /ORGANISM="Rhizochromulina marina cf, Strain CCMP1243" /LENGTH=81 /DNA_ID=CAMNT_0006918511 /DNA_START=18 /DNA_END=259 /DNA_ORIENTATION=+
MDEAEYKARMEAIKKSIAEADAATQAAEARTAEYKAAEAGRGGEDRGGEDREAGRGGEDRMAGPLFTPPVQPAIPGCAAFG